MFNSDHPRIKNVNYIGLEMSQKFSNEQRTSKFEHKFVSQGNRTKYKELLTS